MRELRVDFAARRPVGVWPWVVLILMLGGLAAYQGRLGWNQQMQLSSLHVQQATLAGKVELAERTRWEAADKREVKPPYWADATAIARVATFPLNRVLASLESAQALGVKVTGIEAAANESSVRIDVEFADHPSLLAYLEAINAGEPTPRWVLLQAQVSSVASAGNSATLISDWSIDKR